MATMIVKLRTQTLAWSEVAQLYLNLCDPMDYSLPGSSIHEIFQVRIPEWVAISFSRESSWPRDWTWVFRIAGRLSIVCTIREDFWASLIAQLVKNPPAMQESQAQFLGLEDLFGEGMGYPLQ